MSKIVDHKFPGDLLNAALEIVTDERDPDAGNASHRYEIFYSGETYPSADAERALVGDISFQYGPRDDSGSIAGCTDAVLISILLDRYRGFQSGPFKCRENAVVITKLEEALMWMHKRVLDRQRRGVLGQNKE